MAIININRVQQHPPNVVPIVAGTLGTVIVGIAVITMLVMGILTALKICTNLLIQRRWPSSFVNDSRIGIAPIIPEKDRKDREDLRIDVTSPGNALQEPLEADERLAWNGSKSVFPASLQVRKIRNGVHGCQAHKTDGEVSQKAPTPGGRYIMQLPGV